MNVKDNIYACYCSHKTCTLTSRSGLESYKRLVSVSSRNFNVSSRLVKPTSRSRLGLELLRLVSIPGNRNDKRQQELALYLLTKYNIRNRSFRRQVACKLKGFVCESVEGYVMA